MVEQPGVDAATTVESGAPLALLVLGVIGLGCAAALRAESAGTAWREPVAPETEEGVPGEAGSAAASAPAERG
jgi:hypothetical protein